MDALALVVPCDPRVARRARQSGVGALAEGAVDSYADTPAVQEAARRLLEAVGPAQDGDGGGVEPLPALENGALGFRPATSSEYIPEKWRIRALSRAVRASLRPPSSMMFLCRSVWRALVEASVFPRPGSDLSWRCLCF